MYYNLLCSKINNKYRMDYKTNFKIKTIDGLLQQFLMNKKFIEV